MPRAVPLLRSAAKSNAIYTQPPYTLYHKRAVFVLDSACSVFDFTVWVPQVMAARLERMERALASSRQGSRHGGEGSRGGQESRGEESSGEGSRGSSSRGAKGTVLSTRWAVLRLVWCSIVGGIGTACYPAMQSAVP